MTKLTISADSQITLPRELLRHLGVGPGDQVYVAMLPDGALSIGPKQLPGTGNMNDAFGSLHRPGQRVLTIEEMNEIIAESWAGER